MSHSVAAFFSWGRDFEKNFVNRYAPPLFDGAGTGGRLAVSDFVAWRAASTAGMESLLDAAAGEAPSLAESDDYVELLELMLSQNAVSMFLSSKTVGKDDPDDAFMKAVLPQGIGGYLDVYGFSEEQQQALREQYMEDPYPPAFNSYALATTHDESGFHTLIAYPYPGEREARVALPAIRQRFNYRTTFIGDESYAEDYGPVEVTSVGRFVLARFEQNATMVIHERNEPIHLHE